VANSGRSGAPVRGRVLRYGHFTATTTGFVRGVPLTRELVHRGADLDAILDELVDALIPVGGERPFTATLAATVISATC
jgi:hypothetical protein